ncbi:Conserved oligomeric Golgi complex component 8 [Candidatus Hydrogenisulfobacillus filiaventi]|uniref:Conserved oligomeric Golgi complex component 8 n=1 Tax=Candidatus Hydrogenisulfobacillus filiaventi TaxID=2707344 RepID=A0A6F8ZDP1_9FIRM|nr:Conserved oligomeric Golgi complex component 8 [Candidatus Hydrogenisulfobacillus filiaventi]
MSGEEALEPEVRALWQKACRRLEEVFHPLWAGVRVPAGPAGTWQAETGDPEPGRRRGAALRRSATPWRRPRPPAAGPPCVGRRRRRTPPDHPAAGAAPGAAGGGSLAAAL